jgi:hypothetical protein
MAEAVRSVSAARLAVTFKVEVCITAACAATPPGRALVGRLNRDSVRTVTRLNDGMAALDEALGLVICVTWNCVFTEWDCRGHDFLR